MIVAFAAMLFLSAWQNNVDNAAAGQPGAASATEQGY